MIYAEVFAMGLNAFILFRVWWDWSEEGGALLLLARGLGVICFLALELG